MRRLFLPSLLCLTACGSAAQSTAPADAASDAMIAADAPAPDADIADAPAVAPDVAADLAADTAPDVALDTAADAPAGLAEVASFDLPAVGDAKGGLGITPNTHDYGNVIVGTMSDLFTFTVFNNGSGWLDSLAVTVDGNFAFVAGNYHCATGMALAPNGSCIVEVVFAPTSRGSKQGTVTARAGEQTVVASLIGLGQARPELAIAPAHPEFVGIVGQVGAPVTFTIANVGDAATGQVTITFGGTDADQFKYMNTCLAPLSGGGSCTVGVSFAPTSAGTKTATLSASGHAGGMATVTLTGLAN